MEKYKIIGNISAGAHGLVLEATTAKLANHGDNLASSEMLASSEKKNFAIKKIFIKKQNVPLSIIREIKSLQLLDGHSHIISLLDVFVHASSINMVFPLSPVNLTALIYEYDMTKYQKSAYTYMLLDGIEYCHHYSIVHRDLKPSNLLIDWQGLLKICDFGQARLLPDQNELSDEMLSHQVCTRWYRSPELLYGSNRYDLSIDMWSIGCIVGEMNQKWPLFRGESDIEQLCLVIRQLGKPPNSWSNLPDYNKVTILIDEDDNTLHHSNKWFVKLLDKCENPMAVNFVRNLCQYQNRPTAKLMKDHNYVKKFQNVQFDIKKLVKLDQIRQPIGPPNNC